MPKRTPLNNHRTIDRVTQILEQVVYTPGVTFSDLVRALDAPKSSVHGFVRGLLGTGWLHEDDHRFYLGPAVYGLTLASGHIRAGLITQGDLLALHQKTGLATFVGVQAGDHLVYVAEAGSDHVVGFAARSNIRRSMLMTAGGKALLAERPEAERESYLRRRNAEESELVDRFLEEYEEIKRTGIATNVRRKGAQFAIAAALHGPSGNAVASVTLVGPTPDVRPRIKQLGELLVRHFDLQGRSSVAPGV